MKTRNVIMGLQYVCSVRILALVDFNKNHHVLDQIHRLDDVRLNCGHECSLFFQNEIYVGEYEKK
jgi:hypothetical protein